jgi:hypothetical protein
MIFRFVAVALLAFTVSGCATFQAIEKVASATVPASVVLKAANAFNIVKAGATRFAQYCVQQNMAPAVCDKGTRRIVSKAVRAGTSARDRALAEIGADDPACLADINQCRPAPASVYNLMVGAVQDLQNSPANSAQFVGAQ